MGPVMKRRSPFTALLSSYVISLAGTSMSALAIPWLVLSTTGSAARTGFVAFAQMGPYVLAQALAGPVVDRVGLRRSFLGGNAVAAVAVGLIPAAYAAGWLSLPVLAVLIAVAGAVRGAADCANGALVPATAAAGGIPMERAAGLNSSANRTALLLGAPLAGVLLTIAAPPWVIAIDAATFAVAALIGAVWVRVDLPEPAAPEPGGSHLRTYGRDLAAGLRFIRGDRVLLGIITMVAVTNLLDQGLTEVMLPVWVRDEMGSPGALGLVVGIGGVGALLGNLLGAWLGPKLPRRMQFGVGFLLGGSPRFFVLALAGTLPPVVIVTMIAEVFGGSLNAVLGAAAYERIPDQLRARVLGVVRASSWIGIPVGALVGGYLTEAVGARTALLVFGAIYLVTTLAPFIFPAWRGLERRPVTEVSPPAVGEPLTPAR
jgi:MFS family permease